MSSLRVDRHAVRGGSNSIPARWLALWLLAPLPLVLPVASAAVAAAPQDRIGALSSVGDHLPGDGLEQRIQRFGQALDSYQRGPIRTLRQTNKGFSIAFVVAGITLTLLATSLGAVESQNSNVQRWTKFAIGALGAGAVAFQALNSTFPVSRRAGEYAAIEAELAILQDRAQDIKDEEQLQKLKQEFYDLIRRAGKAEASGS